MGSVTRQSRYNSIGCCRFLFSLEPAQLSLVLSDGQAQAGKGSLVFFLLLAARAA